MNPARKLPRWSLAALSSVIALVCGWAALVLPWREWTIVATLTASVALVHGLTAVVSVSGHRGRARVWRLQAIVSLLYLGYLSWNLTVSAVYIAELYGGLGRGVAASLGLVWLIAVGLFVPLSVWGLALTGGIRPGRNVQLGALVLVGSGALALWQARSAAAAAPTLGAQRSEAQVAGALEAALGRRRGSGHDPSKPLMTGEAVACNQAVDSATNVTVVVTALVVDEVGGSRVESSCVQGTSVAAAAAKAGEGLADHETAGPIKFDVITAARPLVEMAPVVDSLGLRPGLDGVCEGQRCLMPWQLLALDMFTATAPLDVVRELRFGFDPVALRRALAERGRSGPILRGVVGLTRIETYSFVSDRDGVLHSLRRAHREGPPLTTASLAAAQSAAEDYIVRAQGDDGRFAYRLDPFKGLVSYRGFSLARQAGTTLALCEVARDRPRARRIATAALAMLAEVEQVHAGVGMLQFPPGEPVSTIGLGNTALASIAFLSCRDLVGPRFDATIDRLTRFLLLMQRADGSFHPRFDVTTGEPMPGPDPLYAVGQAVFGLSLLEKLTADEPGVFAEHDAISSAVTAAMDYIATDYWDGFAADFFYMEENWHCLAARASLGHHRHAGYERFCIDYVTYKSRLILDAGDGVAPDLVGGYGFGNVLLPHTTGSAGFGEAAAAALALAHARGEARPDLVAKLRLALGFLVHFAWDEVECFACSPDAVGGFSETMGSPHIRIDYVQHAMAALGHGGAMLEGGGGPRLDSPPGD